MRFKSVKSWSVHSLARVSLLGLLSLAFLPFEANALSVTPMSADGMTTLGNHTEGGSLYYYPSTSVAVSSTLLLDTSDPSVPGHLFDLTQSQSQLASSSTDMLRFQVTPSASVAVPATPQQLVLSVFATGSMGTHLVPIAFVEQSSFTANGGVACSSSSLCQGSTVDTTHSLTYFLAVQVVPGIPIQIGLYPRDICAYYSFKQGAASGCTADTVTATGGSSNPISLTFVIANAADINSAPADVATGTPESASLSLAFVSAGTTISTAASQTDIYFPGDGQIFFNANSGTNTFSLTTPTGAAPVTNVIVVANANPAAASMVSGYSKANTVSAVLANGSVMSPVGGFTNTTPSADHPYNMSYMIRDAAGLLSTVSDSSTTLTGVRTSTVRGFLGKSSCFIATAAFDSIEAAPVAMLRHFRDRVLLRSHPGRLFVKWYYHWSPDAAEWLLRHPLFRFPVLLALIPVEVIAWLFLHPAWIALFATLNTFVFIWGLRGWQVQQGQRKGALGEG